MSLFNAPAPKNQTYVPLYLEDNSTKCLSVCLNPLLWVMYLNNLEDRGFKVFLSFYTDSILQLLYEIHGLLNKSIYQIVSFLLALLRRKCEE